LAGKRAQQSVSRQLASHVICTRARFQSFYDEIAEQVSAYRSSDTHVVPFLAAVLDDNQQVPPNDHIAFARAFESAEKGHWLDELVRHCISQAALELSAAALLPRLGGISKRSRTRRVASAKHTVLQAIFDYSAGFSLPAVHAAGMLRTIPKICVITVRLPNRTETQGTGFLVGPQTVLTAWHVVAELIDPKTGRPLDGSDERLSIDFDFIDPRDGGSAREGVISYPVVEDWLVQSSPCHNTERQSGPGLQDENLDPAAICSEYLDFAVVRLKGSPGRDRGVVALSSTALTDSDVGKLTVTLFQHPQRFPLRFTAGALVGFFGSGDPRPRLRHEANSDAGSSGGLCVNADFEGVGLHQAAIVNGRGKPIANQAVPTALIAPRLANAFEALPELDPLWHLRGSEEPVVGREEFQRAVWRAGAGETRIITVGGARHSGLSFSKRILSSLLPTTGPILVEISADEVGRDARSLAALLLRRSGVELPAAEEWPDEARAGTTSEAWVRDQLAPALARHLAQAASGRVIWIIIEHLDRHSVPEGNAFALLLALMAAQIDAPFLRFLLLGVTQRIAGLDYRRVSEDRTYPPRLEEIETYIRRRTVHEGPEMSPEECGRWAQMVLNHATAKLNSWEEAARSLLANLPLGSPARRA
jgi:hypothetical protein